MNITSSGLLISFASRDDKCGKIRRDHILAKNVNPSVHLYKEHLEMITVYVTTSVINCFAVDAMFT